jgi:5'-nucleotidase
MILVTNDDGIYAPGLWDLVCELRKIGEVAVVAPDREQSAVGTAVTLRQPLRTQSIEGLIRGVETHIVEGTPSDSVILALGKLVQGRVDLIVSGINNGPNLGDDVLISGTVSAALQGYLHDLPSFAVSVAKFGATDYRVAARFAALVANRIQNGAIPGEVFFNINVPDLPLRSIKGVRVTTPAHKMHLDTVENGTDGKRDYFWLVRRKLSRDVGRDTDIWAVEASYISITPLHATFFHHQKPGVNEPVCDEMMCDLRAQDG